MTAVHARSHDLLFIPLYELSTVFPRLLSSFDALDAHGSPGQDQDQAEEAMTANFMCVSLSERKKESEIDRAKLRINSARP